jgi:hypothetical protein
MPHLRGTGPANTEIPGEHEYEQQVRERVAEVWSRIAPRLLNGRQLIRVAALA